MRRPSYGIRPCESEDCWTACCEVYEDENSLQLVMEKCDGDDLFNHLAALERYSPLADFPCSSCPFKPCAESGILTKILCALTIG